MRANITISNWKSPEREERKYHMYELQVTIIYIQTLLHTQCRQL